MERLVLVHGSVVGGRATWSAQRPLARALRARRARAAGFPPNPPVDRVDFEDDAALVAELLEPGDHLVGHSYGGVISLLAAAARPERVRSLTVIEPPATRVALDNPDVAAFAAGGEALCAAGADRRPRGVPAAVPQLRSAPTSSLPRRCRRSSSRARGRSIVERGPWEAEIPLDALAAAPFPKLVVSGAHHPAFDAICDVLEQRARRRARRPPRVRPHRAAPPGLQRPPRRLRRARLTGARRP